MLCEENQINDFVENLEDIEILFKSMSPATVEFFQNAFNQTRFTKRIKNLKWRMGDRLKVFGTQSSVVNEKIAALGISKRNEENDEKDSSTTAEYRQVMVKKLTLDWVHAGYKGFQKVGFKELILALADAPHESLFSTQFIIALVQHFWDFYYKRIFFLCFVPYIIYFLSTLVYVASYAVEGIEEDQKYAFTLEFVLRIIIVSCVIYFAVFEFISIFRDGKGYFLDPFNYFDWAAFFLNFYIVDHIVNPNKNKGVDIQSPDIQTLDEDLSRALDANDDIEEAAASTNLLDEDR